MPAPKYARPERDGMIFITTIISRADNHVFQLSLRDKFWSGGLFSHSHISKIWAMGIPSLRDGGNWILKIHLDAF